VTTELLLSLGCEKKVEERQMDRGIPRRGCGHDVGDLFQLAGYNACGMYNKLSCIYS
jgi:hypothetical protein